MNKRNFVKMLFGMLLQLMKAFLTIVNIVMCCRVCASSEDGEGVFGLLTEFAALSVLADIDDIMQMVLISVL